MAFGTQLQGAATEPAQPPLVDAERRLAISVRRIVEATAAVNHQADMLFGATPQPVTDNAKAGGSAIFYRIGDLETAVEGLDAALRRFN